MTARARPLTEGLRPAARGAHKAGATRVIQPSGGVLTLRGYGLRLTVERGDLVVTDGVGADRGVGRFDRVQPGFRRVVVIGHTGLVTLEAMCWIRDIGAAFAQVGTDGAVVATGAAQGPADVRVRRGQARAAETGSALTVTRQLLAGKVEGQAAVAARLPHDGPKIADALTKVVPVIEQAATVADATYAESQAAALYWNGWRSVPVSFLRRDMKRVPARWLTAGPRHSPLTEEPRSATTPVQALLNYLYGLLEVETRLAILAAGLDPILGVIHADRPSRDSFVYDVMEPARPHVDAYVLHLLSSRQFSRSDFFETRQGVCRLMPTVTVPLASTMREWADAVRPVADSVARTFRDTSGSARQSKPGATSAVVSRVGDEGSRRTTRSRQSPDRRFGVGLRDPMTALFVPQCRSCGSTVSGRNRKYCDICLAAAGARDRADGVRHASARRKAAGIQDRRSAREVVSGRWKSLAAREAEHRDWDAAHGPSPSRDVFLAEVTPTLQSIPVDVLIASTGLSKPMCYRIRRGVSVPHWRHWDTIRVAAAAFTPPQAQDWELLAGDTYKRRIGPVLRALPTSAIRAATGWSESYVSLVRRGHYVPHRRHWPRLLALVSGTAP